VKLSKKITLWLLCLFVFTFKIAVAGVFIDKGLDRVEAISALQKLDDSATKTEAIKHIKVDASLSLAGHVVANLTSNASLGILLPSLESVHNATAQDLIISSISESIFKPPKA